MKSLPTRIGDLRVGDEILYWGTIMKIAEIHEWNTRGLRITGTRWIKAGRSDMDPSHANTGTRKVWSEHRIRH